MAAIVLKYGVDSDAALQKQEKFATAAEDTTKRIETGWGKVKKTMGTGWATITTLMTSAMAPLTILAAVKNFNLLSDTFHGLKSRIKVMSGPFGEFISKFALATSGIALASTALAKFDNKLAQLTAKGLSVTSIALGVLLGLWGKFTQAVGGYVTTSAQQYIDKTKEMVSAVIEASNAMMGLTSVANAKGESLTEVTKAAKSLAIDGLLTLTESSTGLKNLLASGLNLPQAVDVMMAFKDSAAFGRQGTLEFGDAIIGATQGVKNQNSIMIDNAGITKNLSIMYGDYATSIGKTVGKLTEAEKIEAMYAGVMAEANIFRGDAAKLSDSLAGQIAKLNAVNKTLNETMGAGAEEVLKPFLKRWVDIKVALSEINPIFLETVGKATALAGGILEIIGPIITFAGKLMMLAGLLKVTQAVISMGLIPGVSTLTGLFGTLVGVGWKAIAWGLQSIATWGWAVAKILQLPLIALVVALGAGVAHLAEKYEVLDRVSRAWDDFLPKLEGTVKSVTNAFKDLVEWGKYLAEKVFYLMVLAMEGFVSAFTTGMMVIMEIAAKTLGVLAKIPMVGDKFKGLQTTVEGWADGFEVATITISNGMFQTMNQIMETKSAWAATTEKIKKSDKEMHKSHVDLFQKQKKTLAQAGKDYEKYSDMRDKLVMDSTSYAIAQASKEYDEIVEKTNDQGLAYEIYEAKVTELLEEETQKHEGELQKQIDEYQRYKDKRDQLVMDATDYALLQADREYDKVLTVTQDETLAYEIYEGLVKQALERMTTKQDEELVKQLADVQKEKDDKKALSDQFEQEFFKTTDNQLEYNLKMLGERADDYLDAGAKEIDVREWVNQESAKLRIKDQDDHEKKINENTEIQRMAVQGLSEAIKTIWNGNSKDLEDVWEGSLNVFVDNLLVMQTQAGVTSMVVQTEMAAATAGISIVVGLLGMALGGLGGGGGGRAIKSHSMQMKEIFDKFIDDFGTTVEDFSFSLLDDLGKIGAIGEKIKSSYEIVENAFAEIANLRKTIEDLKADPFYAGGDNPMLRDRIEEAEKSIVAQYGIISGQSLTLTEQIKDRYALETKWIQGVSDEIASLMGRQVNFIDGINADMVDVQRRKFTPEELLTAFESDVQNIKTKLTAPSIGSENKINLLESLRDAQLKALDQAERVFGLNSAEFAIAQQDTLKTLYSVLKQGTSEFDQMITVQYDQLQRLTEIRDDLTIRDIPHANKYIADLQIGAFEVIDRIGQGASLPGDMDLLYNFLRIGYDPLKDLPSHAAGLNYVPADNYIAKLHKGERVLTANENKSYSSDSGQRRESLLEQILAKLDEPGNEKQIILTIDGREVGRSVAPELEDMSRDGTFKLDVSVTHDAGAIN